MCEWSPVILQFLQQSGDTKSLHLSSQVVSSAVTESSRSHCSFTLKVFSAMSLILSCSVWFRMLCLICRHYIVLDPSGDVQIEFVIGRVKITLFHCPLKAVLSLLGH